VVTSDAMYFTERAKVQELMQTTRRRWRTSCAITCLRAGC
jgi:hypothetical protein